MPGGRVIRALTLASLLGAVMVGCSGDGKDTAEAEVAIGPEMSHDAPTSSVTQGDPVALSVTAADDDGVEQITLYYRVWESSFWDSVLMDDGGDGVFAAEIPGADVLAPGMEYYFKAEDQGDPAAVSYLPEDNVSAPFSVVVDVEGTPLPFFEDFEVSEEDGDDLYAMGWLSVTEGFAGYAWGLTSSRGYDGESSALHGRGYDGVSEMIDWMVTPALDFTTMDAIQATWWEYGVGTDDADHGLWISTGSPNPADGEFELVTALDVPMEGDWGRSQQVVLSDWAGAPVAYLAWRYAGAYADDWYVDAVSVEALSADINTSFAWSPEPVHPGEIATLTVGLENSSPVDSSDLTVTLTLDGDAGSLDAASKDAGSLVSGAAADVDFELSIDPSWPDNTYLPVDITVTDGDRTWETSTQMVIGVASEGRVSVLPATGGYFEIILGVGDPDSPDVEERVYAGVPDPGALTVSADLTPWYAHLPPAPDSRWYARFNSEVDLSVTAFEIDFGDTTYVADVLTDVLVLEDEGEGLVYLPEPPDPQIERIITRPSTVAPGDVGVEIELDLINNGAATSGEVDGTVVSLDPDATVVDGGPFRITSDIWEAGASAGSLDYVIDVSPDHVSSIPLQLQLILDDGVEQWTRDLLVEVPWVVVRAQGVIIDDSDGGDGDGLLEPGETAAIEIEIGNTGDLDSDGVATASLRVDAGSAVSATVTDADDTLGVLDADDSDDVEFTLTVDGGASLGEVLELWVDVTDDRSTYSAPLQIVLGEQPWLFVSATDDNIDDNFGYTFDLKNALYRVQDGQMQLRFVSATAFDPATAYVEIFGITSGSYGLFRATSQSGNLTLQGYGSLGFVTIYEGSASYPDAYTLQLDWPLDVMELTSSSFTAGFGAGWCSAETGNFCDHFPDGWQHYFTGYVSSDFFAFSWDE